MAMGLISQNLRSIARALFSFYRYLSLLGVVVVVSITLLQDRTMERALVQDRVDSYTTEVDTLNQRIDLLTDYVSGLVATADTITERANGQDEKSPEVAELEGRLSRLYDDVEVLKTAITPRIRTSL